MFSILQRQAPAIGLLSSKLLNEETFYQTFLKDLNKCGSELLIESPFVTNRRLSILLPVLIKLKGRKVRIVINVRDPREIDEEYARNDAQSAIADLQRAGIHVLFTGSHHRKLAIIDRRILYEGSLNVLSQSDSREVMRRIESTQLAWQMIGFIGIDKLIG